MKRFLLSAIVLLVLVVFSVTAIGCTTPSATTEKTTAPDTLMTTPPTTDDTTTPKVSDTTSPTDVTTKQPDATDNTPPDNTTKKPVSESTPTATTEKKPIETTPVTEDTTPEPQRGAYIKVNYEISDTDMGTIMGKTQETVRYGISSTEGVTVKAKLGYKFVGWSDGKTEETRSGDCPRVHTTYTAIFEFDALELPILDLRTDSGLDITDKYNYVPGKISVYNAPEGFNFEDLTMEIRGRGNYTWGSTFNQDPLYNKRPYRIKLSEKMNLLGQGNGKAKSWVLIANHCDQSLLRNQTVMNFAKMLEGIVWEPSATSVDVFLNGEYIGVYTLTEQVQVNKNRINISEDVESSAEVAFLAHRSGYAFNEADNNSFYYDNEPYEIVSDLSTVDVLKRQQMEYIRGRIGECWDAIKYGEKEDIIELIDINSVIDTMIVHEFFKNLDTGHDNFYMFAEVDGKLYFGPVWDFDQCAGNADVGVENYEGLRGSYENNWFENILKHNWFKEMFLERWDELYKDEIAKVPDTIRAQAKAAYNAYCRNFEKWTILGYTDEHGNKQLGYKINRELEHIRIFQTYDEHYEYFAQWMEKRTVWLNNYYHSSEFIKQEVKLNLQGKGTKDSPYLINTAEDFYNFTQVMMNGNDFSGKYLKQTADIDMSTVTFYTGIGGGYTFAGIYNGAGYKINLNLQSANDGCPFPYVTGTVMNVFTTGTIANNGIAAGIARSVRVGGTIVNCGSSCTISSGAHAGGITGSNQGGGGSIVGCFFIGTLQAGQVGPINVYYPDREAGNLGNNYYKADCFPEGLYEADALRRDTETALTATQLRMLHQTLNNNLATTATLSGVQKSELTTWKAFVN
ncbi:MAG: CotH kinase family protein [Clostridia bacterium]|nr:CotH kinase family protein [Clostridia bacterium]